MQHSPGFLRLVEDAKKNIRECTVEDVAARRERGEDFALIDVREDVEWAAGRAKGAFHLGKGVIERDVEKLFPDREKPIVLYCGGGYRSALAAEVMQKMGYLEVVSMDGGIKAWRAAGMPEER